MKKNTLHAARAVLLSLVLILLLLPQRAMAAPSAVLSGDSTVKAGDTVTLTLSVSGGDIYGLTATLNHSSALTLVDYGCAVSGWSMEVNGNKFSLYGTTPTSGSILVVKLKAGSGLAASESLSASFSGITASDGEKDLDLGTASWAGAAAQAKRSDAKLYGITCANASLSPAFDSGTSTYYTTVPYSVEKLSLDYFRNDNGSSVSISGNSLSVGENTITFTVVSEDGNTTNHYYIVATRQQDPNYKKSTDATLSALTLDAGTLSPAFSPTVTDYVAYVPFETKTATLTGTANDSKANSVSGGEPVELKQEGDNMLTISCTAEDGVTRQIYTVHVFRMPAYEGKLPLVMMELPEPEAPPEEEPETLCTCGAAEGEAHKEGCPLYVVPETPVYKLPRTLTLPVLGKTATLPVIGIALALLLAILFLLGLLVGRLTGRGAAEYEDDDHLPPPAPDASPAPEERHIPEPIAVSAPTEKAAEPDAPPTDTPPANGPEAADESVSRMSLDDLLRDIHNM